MLSIIIPVYNTENFLHRCIHSITGQTLEDWEMILINDGSTDGSLAICREYEKKDSRIKVIDKKNEGAGPARNAGIAVATGKYLAFPDSDDRMELDAYKSCIKKMEQESVDLLVFGMKTEIYNDTSGKVERVIEDNIPEIVYREQEEFRNKWSWLYKKMDMGSPCNKIYRRELIEKNNLKFPPLRRMQDGVFNMYYADKVNSFISINKNYFIRTWHSKEFQRRKMPSSFIDCAICHHQSLEDMLNRWGVNTTDAKIQFGDAFSEILMTAETDYLPTEKPSFRELYCYIRKINSNRYISGFYREFSTLKKLRKREYAMLKQWNLVLTMELFWRIKKEKWR